MYTQKIQLYHIDETEDFDFSLSDLTQDLIKFYRKVDIKLEFSDETKFLDLDFDFIEDTRTQAKELSKNSIDDGEPYEGHLIFGNQFVLRSQELNGYMMDPKRLVAAVFLESPFLSGAGHSELLQVCVHEIGHMFNLRHEYTKESPFSSAMKPTDTRVKQTIAIAWQGAKGFDSSYSSDGLDCFPFSEKSFNYLTQKPRSNVLPGYDVFERHDWAAADIGDYTPSIELKPLRDEAMVGGNFAFDLEIENPNKRSINLPEVISPEFRTLELRIIRPDGQFYIHRSRDYACLETNQKLKKNEKVVSSHVIIDGPGGTIFPKPGKYFIKARICGLEKTFHSVEINVKDRPDAKKLDKSFARFLADDAPQRKKAQLKKLDNLLKNPQKGDEILIPQLALLRAQHMPSIKDAEALWKFCANKKSPRVLQHGAAIQKARRILKEDPKKFSEYKKDCLDKFPDQVLDKELHKTLRILNKRRKSNEL